MRNRMLWIACALAALAAPGLEAAVEIDSNTLGSLRPRAIGPSVMSGRIAALDAVAGPPLTVYVGAAGGGVWKSDDGGLTFQPVFDDHAQSIGAIRIDPSDPETIWVGTGESWTRNSVSIGDGVYRSTDGGDSWEHLGLADSERIARIQVHPTDSDTVYVCATGHLWNANPERGVYRTTDGGRSWEAVLRVDEDTGCSDLAIDPEDPRVLYAGMWDFRRQPWTFRSGGPGSGLYKSTDGGSTWRELTADLPAGTKGRIAVAVSPARPRTVYALVESEDTALYRSDDLGESWERLSTSFNVTGRPFYFAYLVPDPQDPMRIYKPGWGLTVSDDGGATFDQLAASTHSDHHALWIDPANPHRMVLGTDGGVYLSEDRGNRFRLSLALPVSQYYEVSYDMEVPYNVYGGLQDNGTWMGPSRAVGGIEPGDWESIGFGDGFHAHVDPSDPEYVYVEWQGGNVLRTHKVTGEVRDVKPLASEGEPKLRYNWNTPIHVSLRGDGTVYVGAQFLFRSRDRGGSWERISPDLTTDDPAKQRQDLSGGLTIDNSTAENHCTIFTISESPKSPEVIWVGTDDGNLQITRDGGGGWTDVTANVPGVPPATWVSHVAAGRHDEATAYVTFDGHRTGDMKPYVYKTSDFGASWTALGDGQIEGYAHVVLEDPVDPDLLFVGTELGLYLSVDGGERWARLKEGLPKVAVRDLALHPREHDLILATHGRGLYILDDVTPLRALTQEIVESKVALLPSRAGVMRVPAADFGFSGDGIYVGSNPPEATITYYQSRRHLFGDLQLEIFDTDGERVASLPASPRKGINRVSWALRLDAPKMPPATSLVMQPFLFAGPRVPLGTYTVRLSKGKEVVESTLEVVADPRSPHSEQDRARQHELVMALHADLATLTYLVDAQVDLRDQARQRLEAGAPGRLARQLEELVAELEEMRGDLVSTSEAGRLSGEERLREELGFLFGGVNGYDGRPTDSQIARHQILSGRLASALDAFDALRPRLAQVNRQLERAEMEPLAAISREAWDAEQAKGGASVSSVRLAPGEGRKLGRVVPAPLPWF